MTTTATILQGMAVGAELSAGHPRAEGICAIRPTAGHVQVRAAATGHGKSANSYTVVPALARTGVVLFAHTEETTGDKVRAMGLNRTGRNTAVAGNVRIGYVATSPAAVAVLLYKAISTAVRQGTGLPAALVVDIANHLLWDNIGRDTDEQDKATVALLDAIAVLDLDTIARLTGVSYEQWANEPVPDLSGNGVAVIAYVLNPLTPGDRVPHQFLTGAASVLLLRRDRAAGNPVIEFIDDAGNSRRGLTDTRAWIKVVKAVSGTTNIELEMVFDLDEDGYRPRWHDAA
jgi:hypothetical protein